ncbi:BCCT family transporter [Endozoicomonas euniceicola]|uniref:BCCT family transporter n=1 Tax=Endozoicomonas euniceicola TaxID=1234143 RepID=A0ABY6GS47_9GAMM|nr:BCCT family transporter [Endozoicomonas euniceicola]UYM14881.1 BCCT family transporter [Endozoicomonas euniceicola]
MTDKMSRHSLNKPVFFISSMLIASLLSLAASFPDAMSALFTLLVAMISKYLGWFYALTVTVNLGFASFFCFSRFGSIKLGREDSKPEFSFSAWLAMLFAAGMGTGLMFFGVAEPVIHFASPPVGDSGSLASARQAMQITFLHWGFHAWAIYAVIGLSIAYFSYRHEQPLTFRSCLYPLIGDRVFGRAGHCIDIFAIVGTVFGVATALAIGVLQISSGLQYLFNWQPAALTHSLLIFVITGLATLSAVSGLDKGVVILSRLNLALATALLLLIMALGPTTELLNLFIQNTGLYLSGIIEQSFNLYAYQNRNDWLSDWTLFYWSYWLSWSPFVGMFIARISKGRSVREMIFGTIVVPSALTFMWFTVFGNTSISAVMGNTDSSLATVVEHHESQALFAFLELFPGFQFLSALSVLIVAIFFITSADSCAIVMSILSSNGEESPASWQRVFWSTLSGIAAALLLLVGGLKALEAVTIASALPLSLIMLLTGYGLLRVLVIKEKAGR